MSITLNAIHRYPVKGLNADTLPSTLLKTGETIEDDRRYALALGSTPVSGATAAWMPKTNFLCLMKNARLAQLETSFESETQALTVKRGGNQVAKGVLSQKIGRTMIEDFFGAFMKDEARGRPKLVEREPDGVLSDHANPVLSIINLASVSDLERVVGKSIDVSRFRGNLIVDGLDAWAEFDLCGKHIRLGAATLEVLMPIDRCAATNVNPDTAERDMNIPKDLQRGYGHVDCGVFARVSEGGEITTGDTISVVGESGEKAMPFS